MNCSFLKRKKAAFIAAFLFAAPLFAAPKGAPNDTAETLVTFDRVREKAVELLLQKKKNQALQLIVNYTKTQAGHAHRADANELLVSLAQKFIHRDAQEAYENSLILTLENPREAMKSNEQCLTTEPYQLDCLIQKMRLHYRAGNAKAAQAALGEIREIVPGSRFDSWLTLLMAREAPDFKNKQIMKNLPAWAGEETMILAVLELDRAFAAKNYSRAKDLIQYFEKHEPEWPDLLFYRQKLDTESAEDKAPDKTGASSDQNQLYATKCKSLSKTNVRRYRYDFELCSRGAE